MTERKRLLNTNVKGSVSQDFLLYIPRPPNNPDCHFEFSSKIHEGICNSRFITGVNSTNGTGTATDPLPGSKQRRQLLLLLLYLDLNRGDSYCYCSSTWITTEETASATGSLPGSIPMRLLLLLHVPLETATATASLHG
jgi:hypothetical protein